MAWLPAVMLALGSVQEEVATSPATEGVDVLHVQLLDPSEKVTVPVGAKPVTPVTVAV